MNAVPFHFNPVPNGAVIADSTVTAATQERSSLGFTLQNFTAYRARRTLVVNLRSCSNRLKKPGVYRHFSSRDNKQQKLLVFVLRKAQTDRHNLLTFLSFLLAECTGQRCRVAEPQMQEITSSRPLGHSTQSWVRSDGARCREKASKTRNENEDECKRVNMQSF